MMKRTVYTIFLILASALTACLSSCTREVPMTRLDGFALGTTYTILAKGDVPDDIQEKADSVFRVADNSMSVFNPASLLSRLNRNETDSLDSHIEYCIMLAQLISDISGGKYDITILPLAEAYGFSGGKPKESVNIDSLLSLVGYRKIAVRDGRLVKADPGIRLDLNSIAKGYTVDMISRTLEENRITDYLADVGGEIFCRGTNARGRVWTVGIETPEEGSYIQGASIERLIGVSGEGVATSGNYRNFRTGADGRKYTHIIDPTTGRSTESNLLSATVVMENCTLADALGTMFIALGLEDAMYFVARHPEIPVLLIYSDDDGGMRSYVSPAMQPYIIQ